MVERTGGGGVSGDGDGGGSGVLVCVGGVGKDSSLRSGLMVLAVPSVAASLQKPTYLVAAPLAAKNPATEPASNLCVNGDKVFLAMMEVVVYDIAM